VNRILFACLAFWLVGCRTPPASDSLSRHYFSEPHMGSLWHITLYAPDAFTASNAVHAAFARITALDQMMTDYEPESELMRLSKSPPGTPVKVSRDLFTILAESQRLADASGGAFDVTAGPVVQLWRRARRQRELPAGDRLALARESVGFEKLKLDASHKTVTLLGEKMRLDLGGIAKGYAADEALRVLRRMGCGRSLVAASGDLAIGDPPPGKAGWRVSIGLPGPGNTNLAGTLLLHNAGVSTSGESEQFVILGGVRHSHIVDPRTGWSVTNHIQTTIVADCATRSDALATTVCVLGTEKGLKLIESDARTAALLLTLEAGTNVTSLRSSRFPAFQNRTP
jgi:FAD:protein FMN transferase